MTCVARRRLAEGDAQHSPPHDFLLLPQTEPTCRLPADAGGPAKGATPRWPPAYDVFVTGFETEDEGAEPDVEADA